MINVGIAGATGYAGKELIKVLLHHPNARITGLYSTSEEPKAISDIYPEFRGKINLPCNRLELKELVSKCDLVFLALPHTISMDIVPGLLGAGKRVIDLSADYRLKDPKIYEHFYKAKHKDESGLKESVYGLPEINRGKIKNARLVANPGCYSTAAILALAPLVALAPAELGAIIIDGKSGVTGAGKKMAPELLFPEVNEDFKAYKVNVHQHIPEIKQILSKLSGRKIAVTFVAHLLPLNRGILETIYVIKNQKSKNPCLPVGRKNQNLNALYKKFYKNEPFVRIREEGDFPRLKDVTGTNFCDIGIKADSDTLIIIAAIDNLLKGASGQAVQNMNIMYNFPEGAALL